MQSNANLNRPKWKSIQMNVKIQFDCELMRIYVELEQ